MASSKSTSSDSSLISHENKNEALPSSVLEDDYQINSEHRSVESKSLFRDLYSFLDGKNILSNNSELAFVDKDSRFENPVPEYTDLTADLDGNNHLSEKSVLGAIVYSPEGEDWFFPATSGMTGYAYDGFRYTVGVKDSGPISAPWASESMSSVRGNGSAFPDIALIVWSRTTLTIFDATNSLVDMKMWMRFICSNTMIPNDIMDVSMENGVLAVARSGVHNGVVFVDFKGDSTDNTGNLITAYGRYKWNGDISQRNLTGRWTGLGTSFHLTNPSHGGNPDYNRVSFKYGPDRSTCIVSGRVDVNIVSIDSSIGSVPISVHGAMETDRPEFGSEDSSRCSVFDDDGWLWISEGSLIQRNVKMAENLSLMIEVRDRPVQTKTGMSKRCEQVDIGESIRYLVSSRDSIFAATDSAVYRVDRGTMEFVVEYSIVGGGGVHEILSGDNSKITYMSSFGITSSGYLLVTTPQGVTIIRTRDNYVVGKIQPDLYGTPTFNVCVLVP